MDLTKYKMLAFAMSSFFAGVTGALYYAVIGVFEPGAFWMRASTSALSAVAF